MGSGFSRRRSSSQEPTANGGGPGSGPNSRTGTGSAAGRAQPSTGRGGSRQAQQVQAHDALPPLPTYDIPEGVRIPEMFLCPITRDIMTEPVVAQDGHTYEKGAILNWLRLNSTSPMTNLQMLPSVVPNHSVRTSIASFFEDLARSPAALPSPPALPTTASPAPIPTPTATATAIPPEVLDAMDPEQRMIFLDVLDKAGGNLAAATEFMEAMGFDPPVPVSPAAAATSPYPRQFARVLSQPRVDVVQYSFRELLRATSNLSASCLVGSGGFGSVYHGVLSGMPVAVKVQDIGSMQGAAAFRKELEVLKGCRSPYLVQLYGYSDDSRASLVYELFEDNLEARIAGGRLLWWDRLIVAANSLRALEYLHAGSAGMEPMAHRDVKSANILLRGGRGASPAQAGVVAKLADVGLANIPSARTGRTTVAVGSNGYLDPDYITSGVWGLHTDVFALGVVMLELLTGEPPVSRHKNPRVLYKRWLQQVSSYEAGGALGEEQAWASLPALRAMADPRGGEWPDAAIVAMACAAHSCLRPHNSRAKVPVVLERLLEACAQSGVTLLQPPPYTPPPAPENVGGGATHAAAGAGAAGGPSGVASSQGRAAPQRAHPQSLAPAATAPAPPAAAEPAPAPPPPRGSGGGGAAGAAAPSRDVLPGQRGPQEFDFSSGSVIIPRAGPAAPSAPPGSVRLVSMAEAIAAEHSAEGSTHGRTVTSVGAAESVASGGLLTATSASAVGQNTLASTTGTSASESSWGATDLTSTGATSVSGLGSTAASAGAPGPSGGGDGGGTVLPSPPGTFEASGEEWAPGGAAAGTAAAPPPGAGAGGQEDEEFPSIDSMIPIATTAQAPSTAGVTAVTSGRLSREDAEALDELERLLGGGADVTPLTAGEGGAGTSEGAGAGGERGKRWSEDDTPLASRRGSLLAGDGYNSVDAMVNMSIGPSIGETGAPLLHMALCDPHARVELLGEEVSEELDRLGVTSTVLSSSSWSPHVTPTASPYSSLVFRGGAGDAAGAEVVAAGGLEGVEGLDMAQKMVVDMVVAKVVEEMEGLRLLGHSDRRTGLQRLRAKYHPDRVGEHVQWLHTAVSQVINREVDAQEG